MNEEDYQSIDQHLQGELSPDQEKAFEERLKKDEAFANAYKISREMTEYLKASIKQPALKLETAQLGKKYFKKEQKSTARIVQMPVWRIGVAIAAAIALLLVVWNPFNTADLYTQFANHPPLALVEKNASEDIAQQAEKAYAQGDYERSFQALSTLIKMKPNDTQVQLALGISALETNRAAEAERLFQLLANGQSSFKAYGQWYLALTYIKNDENDKAKPILENLSEQEPVLKKKAKELLTKL